MDVDSLPALEEALGVVRKSEDSWEEDMVGRPTGMAALDEADRGVDESSGEEDDEADSASDGWMGELVSEEDEEDREEEEEV